MTFKAALHELWIFGLKQARACVFAGSFFILLFLSNYLPLGPLSRYDFLFIASVVIQLVLYWTKIETKDEIKTIALFHVLGLCLEIFKTHPSVGSWSYPEESFFKIGTVPLYSGFMYAAIGSYISQAWRLEKIKLLDYPSAAQTITLSSLIYINFFTNHYIWDYRWILVAAVLWIFRKTKVQYTIIREHTMRLPITFMLIAFFIWIAENISTYLGAWKYPDQIHSWTLVSFGKISSWSLLIIISFIIVANLKHLKQERSK